MHDTSTKGKFLEIRAKGFDRHASLSTWMFPNKPVILEPIRICHRTQNCMVSASFLHRLYGGMQPAAPDAFGVHGGIQPG